jgi:hypothetical protein
MAHLERPHARAGKIIRQEFTLLESKKRNGGTMKLPTVNQMAKKL